MGVSPSAKPELRATLKGPPHRSRPQRSLPPLPRAQKIVLSSTRARQIANASDSPNSTPSVLLRQLLAQNPNVKRFTVQRLVECMGQGSPEASLMLLSVPGMIPMPNTSDLVGSPTMMIAGQMMAGRKTVRLPRYLRERSVPRRALAIAIHTVLPILERAEKLTTERWHWACTPAAKRVLGVLVFLIALPLAFPFLGFNIPHAASLFTISVGIMERDGFAIALGVAIGITSLVLLTGKNLLPSRLGRKSVVWIKDLLAKVTSAGSALKSAMRSAVRWINERIFGGAHVPPSRSTPPTAQTTRESTPRLASDILGLKRPLRDLSIKSFRSPRECVPSYR